MTAAEIVSVTTVVDVDPATAFAVFTGDIAVWWKPKVKYLFQAGRTGVMKFEPGEGGRLLEEYNDAPPFEVGRVLTWAPGERLVFEWRQAGFAPHEITHVDVRFEAVSSGTRITLEHRGWEALPPDHPARRGYTGSAFTSMIGLRWADLLTAFRAFKPR